MRTIPFIIIILLALAVTTTTSSCKKEEPVPADTTGTTGTTGPTGATYAYSSLTAEKSTINTGETTTVTATASGTNLTYKWELTSGSLGDILGNGSQITYTASPCCTGNNTIKCTVSDDTNTESKTVTVVVQ